MFSNNLKKQYGKLTGWDVQYYLRVFYDQFFEVSKRCYDANYKIRNHNTSTNPLRLVEMNTAQGLLESNGFRRKAWEYRTYKIHECMGMSFKEWLSLPLPYLEMILDDIRQETKEQLEHQKRQQQEIHKMNFDGPVHPDDQSRYANHLLKNSKALR